MGYVESNLISGEQVVHTGRLHWVILVPGLILLPVIIGIVPLLAGAIRRATTEMAVTNKRVLIKTGLISRRTVELNLGKIENIAVDQGLLGRMMNYGKITVVGTGGTREPFGYVAAPLDFRRAVQAAADARGTA